MMLDPLLNAAPAIQIHALSAIAAAVIGAWVLWREKGTRLHRLLGRFWVILMLTTATSALFINEMAVLGPFGPIHLFSLFTYVSLWTGLRAIRVHRDVRRHRNEMRSLYVGALMLAGTFTLLPGRRMHHVLFGPDAGWLSSALAIAIALLVMAALILRMRREAHHRRALTGRARTG